MVSDPFFYGLLLGFLSGLLTPGLIRLIVLEWRDRGPKTAWHSTERRQMLIRDGEL